MSWGRTDDSEVLDPDIGSLTDTEYRALHALQQYCLREHRDDSIFHIRELRYAIYTHPDGPKAVTRKQLDKFLYIGLIEPADDPPTGDGRETDDPPKETTSHSEALYKVRNWEKFNPPRDMTATERKRRERANKAKSPRDSHTEVTDESRRDNRDGHGPSRARQRLRPPSRPVPKNSLEAQAPQDQDAADHANEERAVGADHAPLDREQLDLTDACHRLLSVLPDAHADSERIFRAIIDDDYAFDQARDECQRVGGKAGLAVTILRRIASGEPAFDVQLRDVAGSNGAASSSPPSPRPLFEVLSSWLSNAGRYDTWSGVEREIEDRSEARGEVLSAEQVEVLRERWEALQPVSSVGGEAA